jgi:hypothetical protein
MEDEQREFRDFLARLRQAKDKAEFDQFMAERRNRPPEQASQQAWSARPTRIQGRLRGEDVAEAGTARPEFARELPRFVAEVRDVFSDEEIRPYLDHLERMAAIKDEQVPKDDDDDFLRDSAEQLAAKRARLAQLKELLTSTMLGTA